jgi:ComF family protein
MRLLAPLAPPLCVACRAPAGAHPLCAACRRALDWLPTAAVALDGLAVWAPLRYDGPARAVVGRLKFHGAAALADHMAAAVTANAPAGLLDAPLVAVPALPARRRRRGFDHAELLARSLARRTGLPLLAPLERAGPGPRQVGRTRADRLRSPPRFRATRASAERVLLVDDVVTTGATLAACVRALRAEGWTCDTAVAYARTPVR